MVISTSQEAEAANAMSLIILRHSVSGSGNITYTGNPKVDARVSGSGRVKSK